MATRPKANIGLELSVDEGERTTASLLAALPLHGDLPGLFAEWRTLVATQACHGKVAHDAHYVAALRTYGLTHLLTFNVPDFARFPGLTVLDPLAVASGNLPASGGS